MTELQRQTHSAWTDPSWQQRHAVRDFHTLREKIPWLDPDVALTADFFALQITPYYLNLLDPTDPDDPLARIVIPSRRELDIGPGELADPIGDEAQVNGRSTRPEAMVVHRYPDRCLLLVTKTCASYCRYCFRREVVGSQAPQTGELTRALTYVQNTPQLREVILSGGDPLTLSDARLQMILTALDSISHLRALRIHTRYPVFNPYRVTDELAVVLAQVRKPLTVVLHVTHPRELTDAFRLAIERLRSLRVRLLNQTVLLKNCNDSLGTLTELSYGLNECGIQPYYLHLLDLARGTGHFRVSLSQAQSLMRSLRGHLPGYLIPQLMLDLPGGYGKIPVGEDWLSPEPEGWAIASPVVAGHVAHYRELT